MSDTPKDYAEFIKSLPQPDIPFEGVKAFLLSGAEGQVVFFDLPAGSSVPPHSHCAQWGIVVDGEIEFTIGGVTTTKRGGDTYFIGDGVEHSGKVITNCRAIDVFADPNRYQAK